VAQFCYARAKEALGVVAVVATLSKGYDLDYIWKLRSACSFSISLSGPLATR
jgi:hypothetical protein